MLQDLGKPGPLRSVDLLSFGQLDHQTKGKHRKLDQLSQICSSILHPLASGFLYCSFYWQQGPLRVCSLCDYTGQDYSNKFSRKSGT